MTIEFIRLPHACLDTLALSLICNNGPLGAKFRNEWPTGPKPLVIRHFYDVSELNWTIAIGDVVDSTVNYYVRDNTPGAGVNWTIAIGDVVDSTVYIRDNTPGAGVA